MKEACGACLFLLQCHPKSCQNRHKMAFSLRPKSDALGLYGARIEWIAQVSTHPPRSCLAPFWPKGQPQVLIIGRGNFGMDPSKTQFSTAY